MGLTTIIVIVVLTVLFFGAVVWMDLHSRRSKKEDMTCDASEAEKV